MSGAAMRGILGDVPALRHASGMHDRWQAGRSTFFQSGLHDMSATHTALADDLRAYVHEYGPAAALAIIAAICDDIRDTAKGQPAGTIAAINGDLLRHTMTRLMA